MLAWALAFFLVALVAAWLGFFVLAGLASVLAKIVFVLFLIVLIVNGFQLAIRGIFPT
jgi:uncharacterized membrane protein YtjA (UPF0391 family)